MYMNVSETTVRRVLHRLRKGGLAKCDDGRILLHSISKVSVAKTLLNSFYFVCSGHQEKNESSPV